MLELSRNCLCSAYGFPHRPGGGRCPGVEYRCSACGRATEGVEVDEGYGFYEVHGRTGYHTDYRLVSDCCEAELLEYWEPAP